jgi:hypothetical protein
MRREGVGVPVAAAVVLTTAVSRVFFMRREGVVVPLVGDVVLTTAVSRVFFMRKELVFLLLLLLYLPQQSPGCSS